MTAINDRKFNLKLSAWALFVTLCLSNFSSVLADGGYIITDSSRFGDWEVVGPSGGDVRVVAIDPKDENRLYISTLDGQIHMGAGPGVCW
jgi:hypothetical protein